VSESTLAQPDEAGVIRIGAASSRVTYRRKVTPKANTADAGKKSCCARSWRKAGDVRDASLYCPPGIEGVVVDVKIFSRKGQEKKTSAQDHRGQSSCEAGKNLSDEIRILTDERS